MPNTRASDTETDWLVEEVHRLQDEVEDLEVRAFEAECATEDALRDRDQAINKLNITTATTEEKIANMNAKLMAKVLIYSDLIDEYEKIRLRMCSYTNGVVLTTTKLNELRERGGYPKV